MIQKHHIVYENLEHKQKDVIVDVFKGEHFILTQLNRRRKISKGFVKCLKVWLALNDSEINDVS